MAIPKLKLGVVTSQMFGENAYFAWREGQTDCLVVDPGLDTDQLLEFVRSYELNVVAILNTHGHADHIAGNQCMKDQFPAAPLVIGKGDAEKLTNPSLNLSAQYGMGLVSPPADRLVSHGERLQWAGIDLEVRDAPGHSAGHVVFVVAEDPPLVFGGDVLFRGSVGRTDFPDGDMDALALSIRQQLYTLPDDTVVLPGHGPPTDVGHEREHNPFVRDTE
ncbi:MAG: MBL fold metallo-hydrolase [Planctomycetales bacterium]|nr:MBL fold metallo-hydrolase [Planctomycetales bacterium]